MAGTDGGISDSAIINETRPGAGVNRGWATLGNALGGGQQVNSELAYDNGMRIGAQTADALAQAKQRITANQQAEQAAQVVGTEGFADATGIPAGAIPYLQAYIRGGAPVQDVTQAAAGLQKLKLSAALADPNGDPNVATHAALALNPASAAPKAEGLAGNFSSPLGVNGNRYDASQPVSATNTPVYVSPQQSQENQAGIDQKTASAAAERASIPQKVAATALDNARIGEIGNDGKLPAGYQYKIDPDTMDYVRDATGHRVLEPRAGGPRDPQAPGQASGREMQIYSRVLQSAEQAGTDIRNMQLLPRGATTGVLGVGAQPGHGVLQTLTDNLRNKMSDEDTQQYTSTLGGLSRALASIETSGLVPSGTFTESFGNLAARASDTESTRLFKEAQMRQVVENGEKVMMNNPRVPQQFKDEFHRIVGDVQKSIPYTPEDIQAFRAAPKGTQLSTFLASRRNSAAASADDPLGRNTSASDGPPPGTKLVN